MKKLIDMFITIFAGFVLGYLVCEKKVNAKIIQQKGQSDKHLSLYLLMNQWTKIKQEDKRISNYLLEKGYEKIAIYGMNYVGETLYRELNGTPIDVKYAIDKDYDKIFSDIEVLSPDDNLPEVDAMIVTPITCYEEIRDMLSDKVQCQILSIEDLLYEL